MPWCRCVAIGGFLVRLAVFVVMLVVLGMWTPLNILAVCLAFVVLFTVLNGCVALRR